jgi:translation initiation factor IF-2
MFVKSKKVSSAVSVKNYDDIKEGDQLEVFEIKEVARSL